MAHEITKILSKWRGGDEGAVEELIPIVHGELKRLARSYLSREKAGHTLQPTALVNEAYLRLIDIKRISWEDRAHFFAVSATIMRRILVEHARKIASAKRGSGAKRLTLENLNLAENRQATDLIELNDVLEKFAQLDERKARVVELKYFGGLTQSEIAAVLNITERTVQRDWSFAKLWLYSKLANDPED